MQAYQPCCQLLLPRIGKKLLRLCLQTWRYGNSFMCLCPPSRNLYWKQATYIRSCSCCTQHDQARCMDASREWCACLVNFCSCQLLLRRVYASTCINKSMSRQRLQQMLLTFALAHHHHITTTSEGFGMHSDACHVLAKEVVVSSHGYFHSLSEVA